MMETLKHVDEFFKETAKKVGLNTNVGITVMKTIMWIAVWPCSLIIAVLLSLEKLCTKLREL